MSINKNSYPVLYEAYEHYVSTGEKHFRVVPKTPEYITNVLNTIHIPKDNGYIDNVSDNLKLEESNGFSLSPLESMSFDISFITCNFLFTCHIIYVQAAANSQVHRKGKFMTDKTFCPFINGECVNECMFHTISSDCYDDNKPRYCLIASAANSVKNIDRAEIALEDFLNSVKRH